MIRKKVLKKKRSIDRYNTLYDIKIVDPNLKIYQNNKKKVRSFRFYSYTI